MAKRRGPHDDGASAVEYALILGAIAAVIIVAVVALGGVVRSSYSNSCTKLGSAMSADTSKCK